MNIEIRAYEEKDLPEMIRIWNEVVEEGIAFPQEELLDEETGKQFFASQTHNAVAVNTDTGQVCGLYILHPNNVGRCGHICNASYAVRSDCRGLHIGEKLVSDCLAQGKRHGFGILQFNAVVASNIHARHLYERLGFVPLGTIPKGFRMKDGHYEDICPYYKLLGQAVAPCEKETDAKTPETYGEENLTWEEISTEHIVQDEWIDFRRSAYRFPDGSVFEPYYSYSRRDYVVIVASNEDGNYLCVRQFRQGIGEVTTEFPAGGIERTDGKQYGTARGLAVSEDALEAAKRELLEETGYVSDDWQQLLTVPSNATLADNYAYIFMAENCRRSGGQSLDETEFLNVRIHSPAEIEDLIYKGEFQQAVHVMAWLLAKDKKNDYE